MRARGWLALGALALAGCGAPGAEAPGDGEAVARWSGGTIGLAEIEARLPSARTPACRGARRSGGALEELIPCYREIAEELALEGHLVAEGGGADRAIAERLGDEADEITRRARLATFQQLVRDGIEVGDDDVGARIEASPEELQQPGRLTVWNIFRRHEDPAQPEVTLDFLRGLKRRAEAGETFTALAREHSQSETRLRDGLVGTVAQGRLPKRLEDVAFALPDGGVSDPILVREGAVLLYVRNVTPPRERPAQQAQTLVRRRLEGERFESAVAQRVRAIQPPEGARLPETQTLLELLDSGAPDDVVIDVAGIRVSVGELRRGLGLRPSQQVSDLTEAERERLLRGYAQRVESVLLAWDLGVAQDDLAVRVRREAEERAGEQMLQALADGWLQERIRERLEADPEPLREYYRDNEHHYRAPLRFDLRLWTLPFGTDPPRQLSEMERVRAALEAGSLSLDAAAARLGGKLRALGWRELDDLPELPDKAQSLLTQTPAGGYTPAYQEGDALHVLHVAARREPGPRSYEEVAEQVRDDYVRRFGQRLSREVLDAALEAAGFSFSEERLRAGLAPPAAG